MSGLFAIQFAGGNGKVEELVGQGFGELFGDFKTFYLNGLDVGHTWFGYSGGRDGLLSGCWAKCAEHQNSKGSEQRAGTAETKKKPVFVAIRYEHESPEGSMHDRVNKGKDQ